MDLTQTKTKIEKVVLSQPLAKRLIDLGLHRSATMHWFNDFDLEDENEQKKWQVFTGNPEDYAPEDSLPAWTSEELRMMIGWNFNGSEMREPRINPMPDEEITFVNFFPTAMKIYSSSAEANGEWLEHLILSGKLKIEEANERYFDRFKPQKQ